MYIHIARVIWWLFPPSGCTQGPAACHLRPVWGYHPWLLVESSEKVWTASGYCQSIIVHTKPPVEDVLVCYVVVILYSCSRQQFREVYLVTNAAKWAHNYIHVDGNDVGTHHLWFDQGFRLWTYKIMAIPSHTDLCKVLYLSVYPLSIYL